MRRAPVQTRVYPEILKNVLYAIFVFRSQNTDIRDPRICVSLSSGTAIHDLPNFCITVFKYKKHQPIRRAPPKHTCIQDLHMFCIPRCQIARAHIARDIFPEAHAGSAIASKSSRMCENLILEARHELHRLQGERSIHLLQALDYL